MVWPIDTCPSPPIATIPPLRTVRMVVPCQMSGEVCIGAACRGSGHGMQIRSLPRGDRSERPRLRALDVALHVLADEVVIDEALVRVRDAARQRPPHLPLRTDG